MYTANDLLFPHHAIPSLRHLRGAEWQALIDRILTLPESHEETLALMLTMIRLNGCMGCETDSYRAMRGCAACALQTLRRYKGPDQELLDLYNDALRDVQNFADDHPNVRVLRESLRIRADDLPLTLKERLAQPQNA
ncbi:MAG: hypothetical protein HXY40_07935 [Chloroflexi bacterium]|nr:hypothetical protein [Chloroflexota bacterium]